MGAGGQLKPLRFKAKCGSVRAPFAGYKALGHYLAVVSLLGMFGK